MKLIRVIRLSTTPNVTEYWSIEAPENSETGNFVAKGEKLLFAIGHLTLFVTYNGTSEKGPSEHFRHKYTVMDSYEGDMIEASVMMAP